MPQTIEEFEIALKLDHEHSEIWSALGHAYAVEGKAVEREGLLHACLPADRLASDYIRSDTRMIQLALRNGLPKAAR